MLLDSSQAELIDSIKSHSFEFCKTFIEKNQTGNVIRCTIIREFQNYGDGPSKARMNRKKSSGIDDFLKLFRRETYGYGPKPEKSTGNGILYRELPIAGIAARHCLRTCPYQDSKERILCKLSVREAVEDFLLYALDLDVEKEIGLKDLMLIYEKAHDLGLAKVLEKVRTYESINLVNSLYDKYYLDDHIKLDAKDSIQMLETFCDLDSERVELYASSFLKDIMKEMSYSYAIEKNYLLTIYAGNLLKDSMVFYNCQMMDAIIDNDAAKIIELWNKGALMGSNEIEMAWHLGHHDLADYLSNLIYPDNPYGGTSYKHQGVNKPPLPAYNLLEKIEISKAADSANKNLDKFINRFPINQAEWNSRITLNPSNDTLTIPLTKKEWKDHKKVQNPEFVLKVSNLSKKVLDFEKLPSKYNDKVKIYLAERHLTRVNENNSDQTYLYIEMFSAFEEEGLHFETIELFLMDVDRPRRLTLRFEKMQKQKKR